MFTCPVCGTAYVEDVLAYCCNAWYDRSAADDPYADG